jgi:hypothetical protein
MENTIKHYVRKAAPYIAAAGLTLGTSGCVTTGTGYSSLDISDGNISASNRKGLFNYNSLSIGDRGGNITSRNGLFDGFSVNWTNNRNKRGRSNGRFGRANPSGYGQ